MASKQVQALAERIKIDFGIEVDPDSFERTGGKSFVPKLKSTTNFAEYKFCEVVAPREASSPLKFVKKRKIYSVPELQCSLI